MWWILCSSGARRPASISSPAPAPTRDWGQTSLQEWGRTRREAVPRPSNRRPPGRSRIGPLGIHNLIEVAPPRPSEKDASHNAGVAS